MASSVALQTRKIPNSIQSYTGSNTLIERVEQLVKSYESGQIGPLDISVQVDPLIEELFNLKEKDLPLARKGLCQLLKVNVEKVQLELIRHLKPLFRLSILDYDVKNNQTKQFVDLEKQISDILALSVRSFSSEILFGLIELYQDVLERLWLLPHLLEDSGSYVILKENSERMMRDAERWFAPLLKDIAQPEKLKIEIKSLSRMFQQIKSCLPAIIGEIKQLKSGLSSIFIPRRVGNICRKVGDNRRAIVHYVESLELITAVLRDRDLDPKLKMNLENATCTILNAIGNTYQSLGDFRKAIEYHEKHLQIAQTLGDREGEGGAYGNLGIAYDSLGDFRKAIEYHEKCLQTTQALDDCGGKGAAYANLGNAYHSLGDYRKAIEFYKEALQIVQALGDRGGEGNVFNNLGRTYADQNNLPQAEQHFRKSIVVFSSLQHALGDNHQWKITIFEEQVDAYLGLERVLLKQNKIGEALEVSNARRARALNGALAKRKSSHSEHVDGFMNIDQILKFVTATKSTYLVYSFCAPSREEKLQLSIYIILPSGEIHHKALSFDLLPEDSREVGKIVSRFPFGRTKGGETPPSTIPIFAEMEECYATKGKNDPIPPALINRFKDRLKKWYEVFIQPIEQYLPLEKSSPLVVIPDGFLSQLPFAAFLGEKEGKGQYLIERFSLSFAPSLSTLSFLNSSPTASSTPACIVSNPATPDSNISLEESEKHVPQLNSLLKAPAEALFTNKKATIEGFKRVVSNARLVHIACHGEAGIEKNPDKFSVFEGFLKFAPDDSHKDGYLHAQEVASFPLIADLVFLDSCFSGAGKVQREGSIGPIWSFHAAGASSVIGGLWMVPESKLIIELIDNFYTHYLSQSMSKSKALHLAITKAIEQERESPHLWGPLFLSGAN